MEARFRIVFEKLEEAKKEEGTKVVLEEGEKFSILANVRPEEIDEIAAVRNMVLEVIEPEPQSYSTS